MDDEADETSALPVPVAPRLPRANDNSRALWDGDVERQGKGASEAMSSAPHIRRATSEDWDAVWPLLHGMGKVGPMDAARQRFERIVRDPSHYFSIVMYDDALVGYAWAQDYGAHLRTGDRTARLHDLFVRPERRGRGIGAAIFRAVREWARQEGVRYLERQASLSAIPFYEHLGYTGDPCPQPEYPYFAIDFAIFMAGAR